ncbi:MAG: carbamoyl-phosphate synthase large subunit [Nitrospirae bacterium]|nr:carbamoyl-phosphate synthase large subunit [Nitrospirota bacterium]
MPKRTDIKKILIIGSGPIVIGQACEFDYSGTQACKALKEEGYKVILVNSNPATIMTDPEMADRTYIEPITPEVVSKIVEKEKPDSVLPTMGGQVALNIAVSLSDNGILQKYSVKLIGANPDAIKKAEDRNLFKEAMKRIGLEVPESVYVHTKKDAMKSIDRIGFPAIIRPSFTLGGTGGNVAFNIEEFKEYVDWGLKTSPVGQILIEESVLGLKEFELEVMRDKKDNVVIICSIENFDPMGIHTGDSITVAPAQTLTDKEYQIMRDGAIKIMREIGVDTGGSNIQFAVNPEDGRLVVIEMNPRVSRSSALASKATGFPIAKIAAKLAVGLTLDEIPNDITKKTPASFEPSIDYVVVKIPRFTFEKFPEADDTLTTQMKSVGEAMAIGRTFKESLQKAIRSLEIDRYGFETMKERKEEKEKGIETIKEKLRIPNWERLWYIADAVRVGISVEEIYDLTKIDPWFLNNIKDIIDVEIELKGFVKGVREIGKDKTLTVAPYLLSNEILRKTKETGFSDIRIARLLGTDEKVIRSLRKEMGIKAVFKTVDTCAAEFEAYTPYLYSTYERPFYRVTNNPPSPPLIKGGEGGLVECEANPSKSKKIMILGGGPNRIGQGIEFDYCCVHGAFALKEDGYETIMVNCNPETVSTDYDTSDRLYFEPLTIEDVLNIIDIEKPDGVIVQFGGQTPLKLAVPLEKEGVKIIGTSPDSIDRAEDRKRFKELLHKLNLRQAESGTARSFEESAKIAKAIGYPVMVRPSYVLGGRAMEIVYDEKSLREYMIKAVKVSPEHPILIDKYLEDAIEIDVDAISDGIDVVIGGIMEHIEEAGVHSGDSAMSLPPYSLGKEIVEEIKRQTRALAIELKVIGLMNIQFAVKGNDIYILEVNPRASRTIPFVSKAIGVPLAKMAARIMAGKTLKKLDFTVEKKVSHISVKESVFPFEKFPGVDTILGPEMKSTGEVMGIDLDFGKAFAKAQAGVGTTVPLKGKVLISVRDEDKPAVLPVAKKFLKMGFTIEATKGTAEFLKREGLSIDVVNKVTEGRPHIVDHIKNGDIDLVINTVSGKESHKDSYSIRRTALTYKVPYFTTMGGARAATYAIAALLKEEVGIRALQEYHILKKDKTLLKSGMKELVQ